MESLKVIKEQKDTYVVSLVGAGTTRKVYKSTKGFYVKLYDDDIGYCGKILWDSKNQTRYFKTVKEVENFCNAPLRSSL